MASKNGIAVAVIDGVYSALSQLGFPLPALLSMQEAGYSLCDACQTHCSGFSVSFFHIQSRLIATRIITETEEGGEEEMGRRSLIALVKLVSQQLLIQLSLPKLMLWILLMPTTLLRNLMLTLRVCTV